ncbi:MAG: hypothetical protein LBK99_17465 [Opitutaceae bacterium]|nr:hypothetical protein [Opitutaceae bacterium]
MRPRDRLAPFGQQLGEQPVQTEAVPQRERKVAFAKIAAAFDPQARQVGLLPLLGGGDLRADRLETGQGWRVRSGGGCLAPQQGGQIIPVAAQAGQLALVELAQRGDHLLARAARRSHRAAKIPIAVVGSPDGFAFAT